MPTCERGRRTLTAWSDSVPTIRFRLRLDLDIRYFNLTDPNARFDVERVLTTGIVEANAGNQGKFHNREIAKPGEIVVFGRRWRLIDRWLGEWP